MFSGRGSKRVVSLSGASSARRTADLKDFVAKHRQESEARRRYERKTAASIAIQRCFRARCHLNAARAIHRAQFDRRMALLDKAKSLPSSVACGIISKAVGPLISQANFFFSPNCHGCTAKWHLTLRRRDHIPLPSPEAHTHAASADNADALRVLGLVDLLFFVDALQQPPPAPDAPNNAEIRQNQTSFWDTLFSSDPKEAMQTTIKVRQLMRMVLKMHAHETSRCLASPPVNLNCVNLANPIIDKIETALRGIIQRLLWRFGELDGKRLVDAFIGTQHFAFSGPQSQISRDASSVYRVLAPYVCGGGMYQSLSIMTKRNVEIEYRQRTADPNKDGHLDVSGDSSQHVTMCFRLLLVTAIILRRALGEEAMENKTSMKTKVATRRPVGIWASGSLPLASSAADPQKPQFQRKGQSRVASQCVGFLLHILGHPIILSQMSSINTSYVDAFFGVVWALLAPAEDGAAATGGAKNLSMAPRDEEMRGVDNFGGSGDGGLSAEDEQRRRSGLRQSEQHSASFQQLQMNLNALTDTELQRVAPWVMGNLAGALFSVANRHLARDVPDIPLHAWGILLELLCRCAQNVDHKLLTHASSLGLFSSSPSGTRSIIAMHTHWLQKQKLIDGNLLPFDKRSFELEVFRSHEARLMLDRRVLFFLLNFARQNPTDGWSLFLHIYFPSRNFDLHRSLRRHTRRSRPTTPATSRRGAPLSSGTSAAVRSSSHSSLSSTESLSESSGADSHDNEDDAPDDFQSPLLTAPLESTHSPAHSTATTAQQGHPSTSPLDDENSPITAVRHDIYSDTPNSRMLVDDTVVVVLALDTPVLAELLNLLHHKFEVECEGLMPRFVSLLGTPPQFATPTAAMLRVFCILYRYILQIVYDSELVDVKRTKRHSIESRLNLHSGSSTDQSTTRRIAAAPAAPTAPYSGGLQGDVHPELAAMARLSRQRRLDDQTDGEATLPGSQQSPTEETALDKGMDRTKSTRKDELLPQQIVCEADSLISEQVVESSYLSAASALPVEESATSLFTLEELNWVSLFVNEVAFAVLKLSVKSCQHGGKATNHRRSRVHCQFAHILSSLVRLLFDRDSRIHFVDDIRQWNLKEASSLLKNRIYLLQQDILAEDMLDINSIDVETGVSSSRQSEQLLKLVLRHLPQTVPFDDRVLVFHHLINRDRKGYVAYRHLSFAAPVRHIIRRSFLAEDGLEKLGSLNSHEMKGAIRIGFVDDKGLLEDGIDGGGLFKEFLIHLARTTFNPEFGLFQAAADQSLYPSPIAEIAHPNAVELFHFLGKVVGKALYEKILIEPQFNKSFLSRLLGRTNQVDDLLSLDTELHKNLLFLKQYQGDVAELALTFSVTTGGEIGNMGEIDLIPNGRNIQVTQETKLRFIHSLSHYKSNVETKHLTAAFLNGLHFVITPSWLKMFSQGELQKLISGVSAGFDVEDLRSNSDYAGGYNADSATVVSFWNVLAGFTQDQQSALLSFVTSCSRAPLLGFCHMLPSFTISRVPDIDRLPSASTCTNLLKLPDYKDEETVRSQLLKALDFGGRGFGLS